MRSIVRSIGVMLGSNLAINLAIMRVEKLIMREDCKDNDMSFMVVSRTGCPDVGKAAMDYWRWRPILSGRSWLLTLPEAFA